MCKIWHDFYIGQTLKYKYILKNIHIMAVQKVITFQTIYKNMSVAPQQAAI